jgi:hypothetical protein
MDAESVAQFEQIVSGAEGRLRKGMATLGTSLRQELGEKLDEKVEEAKRHSGVLYEDVLHRLDLVVEGHQGLQQGLEALRGQVSGLEAKVEHQYLELRALIQLSYHQLQERVETLEQRVQLIEKRLGLSA